MLAPPTGNHAYLLERVEDLAIEQLHQPVDLAVTVPAVLPGQFDHVRRQALLVGVILGRFTLRRTMLPNH